MDCSTRCISPKRAVRLALVCLLLGAATTVAVAWGLALFAPFWPLDATGEEGRPFEHNFDLWESQKHVEWWRTHYQFDVPAMPMKPPPRGPVPEGAMVSYGPSDDVSTTTAIGLEVFRASATLAETKETSAVSVCRYRSGLPMLAMSAARWRLDSKELNQHETQIVGGFEIDPPAISEVGDMMTFLHGPRLLPLRPILPGFIINTLFYGAIWFALFFGLGAARRIYRRKRGRCIICGYDLRGGTLRSPTSEGERAVRIEGCPECGWNRSERPQVESNTAAAENSAPL